MPSDEPIFAVNMVQEQSDLTSAGSTSDEIPQISAGFRCQSAVTFRQIRRNVRVAFDGAKFGTPYRRICGAVPQSELSTPSRF